jgi:hypothetical protein
VRLALTSPIRVTSELIAVADVDTASRTACGELSGSQAADSIVPHPYSEPVPRFYPAKSRRKRLGYRGEVG